MGVSELKIPFRNQMRFVHLVGDQGLHQVGRETGEKIPNTYQKVDCRKTLDRLSISRSNRYA